jgi:hypothetical protein
VVDPAVLAEVRPAAKEGQDRGAEAPDDGRIASLKADGAARREALLVEVFQRGTNGRWQLPEAPPGRPVHLEALGVGPDRQA